MTQPTPIELHNERVKPDWIDYNGHMNVAYYLLVFDHATDALLDLIGLDQTQRELTGKSVFVAEAHLTYEKEVKEDDKLHVSTQLLGSDEKRMHIFHRMFRNGRNELAATNELMVLSVDLLARRVAPLEKEVRANIETIVAAHAQLPRPKQAGRQITVNKS